MQNKQNNFPAKRRMLQETMVISVSLFPQKMMRVYSVLLPFVKLCTDRLKTTFEEISFEKLTDGQRRHDSPNGDCLR